MGIKMHTRIVTNHSGIDEYAFFAYTRFAQTALVVQWIGHWFAEPKI